MITKKNNKGWELMALRDGGPGGIGYYLAYGGELVRCFNCPWHARVYFLSITGRAVGSA